MVTLLQSYQQSMYGSPTRVGAESREEIFQQTVNSRIDNFEQELEKLKLEHSRRNASLQQTLSPKTTAICMNCGIYGHLPYHCESSSEQINAFQNFRYSTLHKFPNFSQNFNYINPQPISQIQNTNLHPSQQPYFPYKKTFTPHTTLLPSLNLEFKDLRNILLRIKSSQEGLSERITRCGYPDPYPSDPTRKPDDEWHFK